MTAFEERKRKILSLLSQPADRYTDASPKGSVDDGIRELVDEINGLDGFVTTSSCAGRIAVYQEGSSNTRSNEDEDAERTSAGGKGGGQWLYVSHDPVEIDGLRDDGTVLSLFSLSKTSHAADTAIPYTAYVHLKFEPMILHVLCSSLDNARKLLGAALSSGFRESGISSISNDDMVLVAIRTNGLAFDSIIATVDPAIGQSTLLVTEQYLRLLIGVGNHRFEVNKTRKDRFRAAFLQAVANTTNSWEPADVRRARKRAEGLARRQELESKKAEGESQPSEMYTMVETSGESQSSEMHTMIETSSDGV